MADDKKAEQATAKPAAKPHKDRSGAKYVLRAIAANATKEAYEAKARGEKIGWCSSNFPQEIPTTLGLHVVYPENQAAAIAARGAGQTMCEHCEGDGYSNDICAYARISMAFADLEKTPHGEGDLPMPDFMLCCNNICNCMFKWYENIGRKLGIPVIMIDTPFSNKDEADQKRIDYVKGQFKEAVKKLEKITGKKWDDDRFKEVMKISNRTGHAWLKAASYMGYKDPSPLNGFDLFNHMAVTVCARGRQESADAFDKLAKEYEQNVKQHKTTFRGTEKHRILFEGIACWPYLRATSKPLIDNGLNVTATVYAALFGVTYKDFDGLCKAYLEIPNCISMDASAKKRIDACRDGKVDGALIHINRSCKCWSGNTLEVGRRIHDTLHIPVVTFDGDQADPRNFSEGQYDTRIQGFVELMDNEDKKGE